MNVLLAGISSHKDFGFRSLRDAGHFVGVIDELEKIPADWCDWYAAADPLDEQKVIQAARSAGISWNAVLSWEELAIDVSHRVARALGVPSPSMFPGAFRDKSVMHSRLRAAGMPSPNLGTVSTFSECQNLIADADFPVVVKPVDFGGSWAVQIVGHRQELSTAFASAAHVSLTGRVAIDHFVEGLEFSVETVSWGHGQHEVVCITQKVLGPPPYCVEMAHVVPATNISEEQAGIIRLTTCRALDALGMVRGVGHVEIKLPSSGPVVIEAAGRPAGDLIPKLVALALGVNLNLLELWAVTGQEKARTTSESAAEVAAIRFFGGQPGAVVVQPSAQDLASSCPPSVLHELTYWYPNGVLCPDLTSNADRLGYCILAGSRAEVLGAFDAATILEPVSTGPLVR